MIHGVLAFFLSFSPLYLILVLSSFSFQMHHHISTSGSVHSSIHLSVFPFLHSSVCLTVHLSLHLSVCLSVTPVLKLCRWRIELPGWTQSFHFHFYEMFCLLFGWLVHRLITVELKIVKKDQKLWEAIFSVITHIHTHNYLCNCNFISNMRDNLFFQKKVKLHNLTFWNIDKR